MLLVFPKTEHLSISTGLKEWFGFHERKLKGRSRKNIRFPRKQIPFVDTQSEVPSTAG